MFDDLFDGPMVVMTKTSSPHKLSVFFNVASFQDVGMKKRFNALPIFDKHHFYINLHRISFALYTCSYVAGAARNTWDIFTELLWIFVSPVQKTKCIA